MGFLTAASLLAAFVHHDSSTRTHQHFRGVDGDAPLLKKFELEHARSPSILFAANKIIKPYPDELPWVPTGSEQIGYSKFFPGQEIVSRNEAVALTHRLAQVVAKAGPSARSWPLEYYYTRRLVDELQKELAGDEGIQMFRDLVSRVDPSDDSSIKLRGGRFLNEFVARWNGLNEAGRVEMQRITLKYLLTGAKQFEYEQELRDDEDVAAQMKKIRMPYHHKKTPRYEENLPAGPRGLIEQLLEGARCDLQLEVIMNYVLRVHFGPNAQKLARVEEEASGVDFPKSGTFFEDSESSML